MAKHSFSAAALARSALFCSLLCTATRLVDGKLVTISNKLYRMNVTGDIMDAHDGSYNQWESGGPWYYYAMGYGTCKQGQDKCHGCGYGYSWIGVWKSADMSNKSWTLLRDARDDSWPRCNYFRVHTVFNRKTNLYVMWVNLNHGPAPYGIGTSKSPEGPFKFVHAIDVGRKLGGDFDIFVDDDGAGFIIYTAHGSDHSMPLRMAVERLTDDFLQSVLTPGEGTGPEVEALRCNYTAHADKTSGHMYKKLTNTTRDTCCAACWKENSTCDAYVRVPSTGDCCLTTGIKTLGETKSARDREIGFTHSPLPPPPNTTSGPFGLEFVEAPAMFKRNATYYALFGNCCCFCGHGSGVQVYTAAHPLGPFTFHNNVGCLANGSLTPGCGCGMDHKLKEGGRQGQQCSSYGDSLTKAQQNFVIQIPQADGSTQFVWTGDRWQSAADGIKAHDMQYWSVLDFHEVNGTELPMQFTWQDEIHINLE